MKDISPETWESMASFSNAIMDSIDQMDLTPTEVIVVLEMISGRLKQLLEAKKGG